MGFVFFACNDGSSEEGGGNIVNGTGEAWVENNWGFVFRANGTFDEIYNNGGMWEIDISGTYRTSGKNLILTYSETPTSSFSITVQYSVTGNTGTITFTEGPYSETYIFTRTKVNIGVFTPPSSSTSLTNGQWVNGNISSAGSEIWYSFNTIAGTTYRIWWNDEYDGDGTKTLDIRVSAFYNDGTRIFNRDDGWWSPASFTPSSNGLVYLRVAGWSSYDTGTFAIVYSTGSSRP
jgi:hypothetical protein